MAYRKYFHFWTICMSILIGIQATSAAVIRPANSTAPDQPGRPAAQPHLPDTLTWQSAFWAMVALALNNIAQPCGRVLGFTESFSCVLKASPVTGPIEAAVYLYDTGRYIVKDGFSGFKTSLVHTLDCKFSSSRSPGVDRIPSRPTDQTTTTLRMVFFVLGALPQAVKLFACTNTVMTQIFATCYIVGYIFDEALIRLNDVFPHSLSPSDSQDLDSPRTLYTTLFSASLTFAVKYTLSNAAVKQDRLSAVLCLVQELCTAIPALCWTLEELPNSMAIFSPTSMILASLVFHLAIDPLQTDKDGMIVKGSSFIFLHYFHVLHVESLHPIFAASAEFTGDTKNVWRTGFFPCTHLFGTVVVGLLGYQYLYDASNTYRPPWTDTLG